jgi:glycosyltransferase involved in cell wall biosynthesis/MoaA/NifB/PqqE/SkfB family radical SAM enzyme
MPKEVQHRVTVVIPVHNAAESICECITSIELQVLAPYEIIVVDDCSTDETKEKVAQFEVGYLGSDKQLGAGATRARGAQKAQGDIIAFLDADCRAPKDWLLKIVQEFEGDAELGGVGGRYLHEFSESSIGRLSQLEEEFVHHIFKDHPFEASPPGGNCAFKRDIWEHARSQKELRFFQGIASGEDAVLCDDLRQVCKIKFAYDIGVYHLERESAGYFRRHLNRGISRTTIIANDLTSRRDSELTFVGYGGWSLFVASLLIPVCIVSFFGLLFLLHIALPLLLVSGIGHVALSARFFRFIKFLDHSLPPHEQFGMGRRQGLRFFLFLRSCCWVVGVLRGYSVYIWTKLKMMWNIMCSVVHFWMPGKISRLFFFVTSRCNARCSFCFNLDNVVNWAERQPTELRLDEIEKIAQKLKRLPYLTMSGGEPFLRKDLPEVVEAFYKYAKLQWLTIPTNAAISDRVLDHTVRILQNCPTLFLTIQISLDSLHEDHDDSRKLPGGFEAMSKTLVRLGQLKNSYPHLRIQIATCYDDFNMHRIQEIIEFCQDHFVFDQQMLYLIRNKRTLVTHENNGHIPRYMQILQQHEEKEWKDSEQGFWHRAVRALQNLTYHDLVKIKLKDEYLRPCHAIQKFATLYDDGEITPCEVLEKMRLGNLKDYEYDFYKLKNDRRLNDVYKKEVIEKKCNCDWMCAISHNLLYDPKTIPRVLFTLAAPGKLAYGGGDHTLK